MNAHIVFVKGAPAPRGTLRAMYDDRYAAHLRPLTSIDMGDGVGDEARILGEGDTSGR